jgi:hypothetical protein
MTSRIEKSIALASTISTKAEETLANVEREMMLMKWPDEFRAIMWEAIADTAAIRARQACKS